MKRILPLLLLTLTAACQTTKPWQREILAKPVMNPETSGSLDVLEAHALGIVEGSVGGFGGAGGGCGCN